MKKRMRWGVLGTLLGVTVAASALAGSTGHAATAAKKPITIGWAFDRAGNMAPFDDPALAAAKIRIGQINKKGGVGGRKLVPVYAPIQSQSSTPRPRM